LKRDLIQGSRPGGDRGPAIVAAAHLTDKPRPQCRYATACQQRFGQTKDEHPTKKPLVGR